jgi:hypothetical protein
MRKLLCKVFGHKFNEYKLWVIVCSRRRTCREYTREEAQRMLKAFQSYYDANTTTDS